MADAVSTLPVASEHLVIEAIEAAATVVEDQIAIMARFAASLAQATDADLPRFYALAESVLKDHQDALGAVMSSVRHEARRRMVACGGEILDKEFIVKLDPQYTSYVYDIELLREAQALLPDEEAANILRHYPERTTVEAERWEPGPAVSILAIKKRYPGSAVAKILERAMTRDTLEAKVIIKLRKTIVAVKNVTRNSEPT